MFFRNLFPTDVFFKYLVVVNNVVPIDGHKRHFLARKICLPSIATFDLHVKYL